MTDSDKKKIEAAKKKYNDAKASGDTAGMKAAHDEAESVRAGYGYSGGGDGSKYISLSTGEDMGTGDVSRVAKTSKSSGGTSTNYGTYEDDLSRLTEAKKKTQIAQLKQARDKALANLDVQEQNIKPAYQNARNQASATSQSGARSFAEYLANRGLTNSGASAQGEINRLSSLQNTLGGIDTAEANAYRDIANQRTAIENDYVSGVANANNAIAQEYYNNLLNYNEQQRQIVNQLKQRALGQYANNYQAYMNTLDPNSMEYLYAAAARGDKMANNYSNSMNNALANIQAGNINYNNAAALGMTVPQAQQYYNNYIAQQQAQAQAAADQLAYERQQQEIANQQKWAQINNDTLQTQYNINKPYYKEGSGDNSNVYTISNIKDMIEKNFTTKKINTDINVPGDYITEYNIEGIINKMEDLYNEGNGIIDKGMRDFIYDYYNIKY